MIDLKRNGKKELGDIKGACKDWNVSVDLEDYDETLELLDQYCE